MKNLICYKTRFGATKKYMEWLAEAINADLRTFSETKGKDAFSNYDTIVVSSATYAGLMPLNHFLKKNWKHLQDKNVIVVAVGAAAADDPWSIKSYNRIPQKIRDKIKYFKIRGEDPDSSKKPDYVSLVNKENLVPIIKFVTGK